MGVAQAKPRLHESAGDDTLSISGTGWMSAAKVSSKACNTGRLAVNPLLPPAVALHNSTDCTGFNPLGPAAPSTSRCASFMDGGNNSMNRSTLPVVALNGAAQPLLRRDERGSSMSLQSVSPSLYLELAEIRASEPLAAISVNRPDEWSAVCTAVAGAQRNGHASCCTTFSSVLVPDSISGAATMERYSSLCANEMDGSSTTELFTLVAPPLTIDAITVDSSPTDSTDFSRGMVDTSCYSPASIARQHISHQSGSGPASYNDVREYAAADGNRGAMYPTAGGRLAGWMNWVEGPDGHLPGMLQWLREAA